MTDAKPVPPRPRLVVRVGVTGHRRLDRMDRGPLTASVGAVLDAAAEAMESVSRDHADAFSGKPELRVISPLAEGADQIVAEIARARGAVLHCPLPFHRDEYARDFADDLARRHFEERLSEAEVIFELDGRRSDDGAAYAAVGRLVVEQCDVLIAIWDGAAERGAGGTAQIVREAVAAGRLVAWIGAEPPHAMTPLSSPDAGVGGDPLADLASRLAGLLRPPSGDDQPARFFRERQPRFTMGGLFATFRDLVAGPKWRTPVMRVVDFETAGRADRPSGEFVPQSVEERFDAIAFRPYAWADGLANVYGGLHRSAFVLNYLMGAAAVLFALIGLVAGAPDGGAHAGGEVAGQAWGAWVELALIATILLITVTGRTRRWHARWIGYRRLAERLRHLRFLAPLGCAPGFRPAAEDGIEWLARAWERDLGLVAARIDEDYLGKTLRFLVDREIDGQIRYHGANGHKLHRLSHRLHLMGDALFVSTAVCCVLHIGGLHTLWLTVGAAVFPAIGAALYGIRSQGEFDRVAERSHSVERELEAIKHAFADAPLLRDRQAELARQAALVMSEEVVDWHTALRLKSLALPA